MALPTVLKLLELEDVKVFKMTADTDTAPTYDTAVDIPGITKIGIAPKVENKKLQGDSKLLDIYSKVTEVELDIEFAELSLDAMKVLVGGEVTTSGTTPNQVTTYSLKPDTATAPYFKLEGRWLYAGDGIGDAVVRFYKCKVSDISFEINDASGNFGTVRAKAFAIPCESNNAWFDIDVRESAQPLA
ncbi:phage major tail protein, phi13 family [Desulfofundulus kuznetsovii DSM 6115]|uniref:Phage major tail protein, phi13 family n=1 Tax=Desulfofundulus kuznetsovii (strain DSM 6115 / VKM B-1805 / 17) TaxID=760568 RepID=A0AAU8P8S5_DESK7|nr:phage major tail protein, phi13 family [Desulfofundulus kuznetsovii DSM 6115]